MFLKVNVGKDVAEMRGKQTHENISVVATRKNKKSGTMQVNTNTNKAIW